MRLLLIGLLLQITAYVYSQNDFIMLSNTYPVVDVSVNGMAYAMLIDTGASINIIDSAIVSNCDVVFAEAQANSFAGMFSLSGFFIGSVEYKNRKVSKFMVGDIAKALKNVSSKTKLEIAGILGTPAIKELGMVIDLRRGIVTLSENITKSK